MRTQDDDLKAPHYTARLAWASAHAGGRLGEVVNLPGGEKSTTEAINSLQRSLQCRLGVAGDAMPGMAQRPMVGTEIGDAFGARLNSGRAVVSTTPGAVWVTTHMSQQAAEAAGLVKPCDGWHSPRGLAIREVSASANTESWEVQGSMGLYHRGYVLRRIATLACDLLPPDKRQQARMAARAYERAHRALKDGGAL